MNTRSMQRQMEQLARAIKPIPNSGSILESTRMEAVPMESTRIEESEPFQVKLYFFENFELKSNFSYEQR